MPPLGTVLFPRMQVVSGCCPCGTDGLLCESGRAQRSDLSDRRPQGPAASTVLTRPDSAEGVRPFNAGRTGRRAWSQREGEECGRARPWPAASHANRAKGGLGSEEDPDARGYARGVVTALAHWTGLRDYSPSGSGPLSFMR
jgi:hypothetical protein